MRAGQTLDILMVTHESPESTRMALGQLLETSTPWMRVWLWHNGDHTETLELVREFAKHPRVFRFHHSPQNERLWAPTNWLLENAEGEFLSKVDDDNVVPQGWAERLIAAHNDFPKFGALGCWRFQDEDYIPELAAKKIREFPGGHRILLNLWVEGSCFVMKRACRDEAGPLRQGQSMTAYFRDLALKRGWINGWYFPFVRYENLDDPRAPRSLMRTEGDLRRRRPLTAQYNGVESLAAWTDQLRRSAQNAQTESIDPRDWRGWRWYRRRIRYWSRRLFLGQRNRW